MSLPLSSPQRPLTDLRRVALLFSGGPAPAANAVIASAASCFSRAGIEVLGIKNGYSHLVAYRPGTELKEGTAWVRLDHRALEGARTTTGIMIGTARANPGKGLRTPADLKNPPAIAPLETVYRALTSLGIDALISIGGDDTLTTAAKFKLFQDSRPAEEKRIRVVHLPKTIDNDYEGIDFTFGYFSAVEMLAAEVKNLLADARSTGSYFLAQLMGRKAGWLAYGAAIAGEASLVVGLEDLPPSWWTKEVVIDPETDRESIDPVSGKRRLRDVFDVQALVQRCVDTLRARDAEGKPYGVLVMAEGIAEFLPLAEIRQCLSEGEYRVLRADEFGHFPVSQLKFSGHLGRRIAAAYQQASAKKQKINGVQLGYEIRCNPPTAFDVILGSQLGVGAYRALAERGADGVMVSVSGPLDLVFRPFAELIDSEKLRARARPIRPEQDFHHLARYLEVRL
jgi:6-phosphofructokinase 1